MFVQLIERKNSREMHVPERLDDRLHIGSVVKDRKTDRNTGNGQLACFRAIGRITRHAIDSASRLSPTIKESFDFKAPASSKAGGCAAAVARPVEHQLARE